MGNGTSIGRVRGLGSARAGAGNWINERMSGLASLILTTFLVVSLLLLRHFDYATMHEWIVRPVVATAIALFIIVNFWHTFLGLRVVIEDYIHEANKVTMLALLYLGTFAGAAFGLFCIIRLALGGAA